jgi:Putative peptidoglycan binding domain
MSAAKNFFGKAALKLRPSSRARHLTFHTLRTREDQNPFERSVKCGVGFCVFLVRVRHKTDSLQRACPGGAGEILLERRRDAVRLQAAQLLPMAGVLLTILNNNMKPSLLVCIGSVTLALTAGAQMPYNHRKAPQRPTTYHGYRGTSAVRQMGPQRTFSTARVRQSSFPTARLREPAFRTTRTQPRMNASFVHRPSMTNTVVRRQTRPPVTNDWRESRFSQRPRPTSSFVNRSTLTNTPAWRERRLDANNRWTGSNFKERSSSFVNSSRSTAFWSGTRTTVTNNWRGSAFAGRQYGAFRNYQSQWHDSGWWRHNCERIVFVTVYSQPFPFFFDAGYWYPAWGYYADAYYPYDGPIYGYNDLPPDEVITNVQIQLYNEGYYSGPIDGILGPDTRAAIADYQADHGLAVTAAIDEPTVVSLGLV